MDCTSSRYPKALNVKWSEIQAVSQTVWVPVPSFAHSNHVSLENLIINYVLNFSFVKQES